MSKTNHPIEQEELMAYLDGELPVDRAGAAAGHLEHCRECQSLAAVLQSVSRRLMEWQVEQAGAQIGPAVKAAFEKPRASSRPPTRRKSWWTFGFASTATLLVVMSLVVPKVGRLGPPTRDQLNHLIAPEPKIARKAEIFITTSDFDRARTVLEDIVKRHSGYFGQLNVHASAGSGRTVNATLRIPAVQRDVAFAEIKKLGRVDSESQTGEEVTSQYVDLEARLGNARNTEQRLTDVLRQRTGKLADVLAVEQEISRVRGEIERMEAEKKALTTRVEFLTLEVNLMEHAAQPQNNFRDAAVSGYRRVIQGAISVTMFLLAYGPSLLIWLAILFFPARFAWKRFRRS